MFARVRVRTAHADRRREEEWLLIEWPKGETEPTCYFLSALPVNILFKELVATVTMRWRIERDYRELTQEVGLGHNEARNLRGFHHHASLCIAANAFLMLERLRGSGKTPLDSKRLAYHGAKLIPMMGTDSITWTCVDIDGKVERFSYRTRNKH